MLTTGSMRVTALLAGAFMLAACGSDKAAGPTTKNNQQIISEMNAKLADTASFDPETDMYRFIALQVAVAGLSAGAPVNPGNVTIDGRSYRFNTTSLVAESRDSVSGDVLYRTTIIVGWRHTNADSVFIAAYTSDDEGGVADRRTSLSLMPRSTSSGSQLANIAAMLRSGQYSISRSISAGGPDQPMLMVVYLGGSLYGAMADDGIVSGSVSYASQAGDCDLSGADEGGFIDIEPDSCELVRANATMNVNTYDPTSEADPPAAGPVVSIPAQAVVGVKLVVLNGGVAM
jgi:hypothetical protein